MNSDKSWKIDKSIPVAVIVTLIAQAVLIGAWVGTISQRLSGVEEKLKSRDVEIAKSAKMEANIEQIYRMLARIEEQIKSRSAQ